MIVFVSTVILSAANLTTCWLILRKQRRIEAHLDRIEERNRRSERLIRINAESRRGAA